jgi:hypothetical protein
MVVSPSSVVIQQHFLVVLSNGATPRSFMSFAVSATNLLLTSFSGKAIKFQKRGMQTHKDQHEDIPMFLLDIWTKVS